MASNQEVQQQMFGLIEQWRTSDLTQKAFCEQSSLPYHVFHYWYKRYRLIDIKEPTSFIKLKVSASSITAQVELILADGKRLLFHQPVSSDYLKAIIS